MPRTIFIGISLGVVALAMVGFYALLTTKKGERNFVINIPQAESPNVEIPNVELPKIELPKIEAPKIEAPGLTKPPSNVEQNSGSNTPGSGPDSVTNPAQSAGRPELAKIQALRKQVNSLPKGNIVLAAPDKMTVGDTRTVSVRVGVGMSLEKLKPPPLPSDQTSNSELQVSSEMVATLVASSGGFEITSNTPERQSVAAGLPTEWLWQIKAKAGGQQELVATLYALVYVGNSEQREQIESYTHTTLVAVRPLTWSEWLRSVSQNISALEGIVVALGATVTAVLGWFGWKSRRDAQATKGRAAKPRRHA